MIQKQKIFDQKQSSIKFLIGGLAGSLIQTLMSPFYVIKIALTNSSLLPKDLIIQKPYKGLRDTAFSLIKKEGYLYLWKSNSRNSFKSFWFQGILFSVKDAIQSYFRVYKSKDRFLRNFGANFLSGALAGAVSLTVIFPMDYPRVMLVRMNGIEDFYKDFPVYLIPVMIYRGLYFGIFDSIKSNSEENHTPSLSQTLAYCFSSTITAQMFSFPFESAKMEFIRHKTQKNYSSYVSVLKSIFVLSIRQCMNFEFPFLYRTTSGSLILFIYEIMNQTILKMTPNAQS